jgi:hypothetical protein
MTSLVRRALTVLMSGAALLATPRGPVPAAKAYQDRAEYNLLRSIQSNPSLEQRLALLHQWRKRYPRSAFRQERFYLLLTTQQTLNRPQEMLRTATAMAADDPLGLGNYWLCLISLQLRERSPVALGRVERSARSLLRNEDTMFTPAHKPEAVSAAQWEQTTETEHYPGASGARVGRI